ncbi:hypothetical protein EOE67_16775 [Rheinheimera riviphila]|uniref:Uncharacterized protein n=1 Tax=Rheinheimera riviphila TaxID=1834037 RepID=A0A437QFP1_9GAMM|nr:hypothetical protein [Rheinheimera riviphila]RVU33379.1 hypothetical protein EOE67_16775 [Rheinheimera riviphila]
MTLYWMRFYQMTGLEVSFCVSLLLWLSHERAAAKELLFWMAYSQSIKSRRMIFALRRMLPLEYIKEYLSGRVDITISNVREANFDLFYNEN